MYFQDHAIYSISDTKNYQQNKLKQFYIVLSYNIVLLLIVAVLRLMRIIEINITHTH